MKSEKKYLNEESYKKVKKKILFVSLIVFIIGLLIGGGIISIGLVKREEINNKYSDSSKNTQIKKLENEKNEILEELENEKQNILKTKEDLELKIKPTEDEIKNLKRTKFNGFNDDYYATQDKIEELEKSIARDKNNIEVIDEVVGEEVSSRCDFEYVYSNSLTSKYCSIRGILEDKNEEINEIDSEYSDSNKEGELTACFLFYGGGFSVIFLTCLIAFSIFEFGMKREIKAFETQQIMPVAKEGIDEIAPSIGNVASEISKGIKNGLDDSNQNKK